MIYFSTISLIVSPSVSIYFNMVSVWYICATCALNMLQVHDMLCSRCALFMLKLHFCCYMYTLYATYEFNMLNEKDCKHFMCSMCYQCESLNCRFAMWWFICIACASCINWTCTVVQDVIILQMNSTDKYIFLLIWYIYNLCALIMFKLHFWYYIYTVYAACEFNMLIKKILVTWCIRCAIDVKFLTVDLQCDGIYVLHVLYV